MAAISLTHVTRPDDPIMDRVCSLYHDAFPPEERRPWEHFKALTGDSSSPFRLFVATDSDGTFSGFLTMWNLPGACYVEHFAVEPSLRGNGTGGAVIDMAASMAGELPLVVEVELPHTGPDAPRRIAFYERHGFSGLHDYRYIQPPYAPGLPPVQLMLMATRPLADTDAFVAGLHSTVYNHY